jgi:hypothetical protein
MGGTTAFAVWECTDVPRADAAFFFLAVIVEAPLVANVEAMTVNASLAPLSNVGLSSSTAPVPRFWGYIGTATPTLAQRQD